jgi:hypothetical protein
VGVNTKREEVVMAEKKLEQMDKITKVGIARFEKDVPFKKELEKRKHPRFLLNLPIEYYHLDDSPISYSSHSINASGGGLLICLHERLKAGQHLNLKIFYYSGSNLLTIETTVQVMWVDELAGKEGEWPHGVKFVSITQQDLQQFKRFLDSLAPIDDPR